MSLEIHMAKVGIGDCILIRMGEGTRKFNLLVDSGKSGNGYTKTLDYIQQYQEIIDYLIVTHDDDDHIMGIFNSIVDGKSSDSQLEMLYSLFYEKKVIMNYWKKGTETLFDFKKTAKIGRDLDKMDIDLTQLDYVVSDPKVMDDGRQQEGFNLFQILWKTDEKGQFCSEIKQYNGCETVLQENMIPPVEDGWEHAEILILSPTVEYLRRYVKYAWKKYKKLVETSTREITFSGEKEDKSKKKKEWDYSIQQLYDSPLEIKEDPSEVNNASISFLLHYNGTLSLFAGDSKPEEMVDTAERYLRKYHPGKTVMPLDFMKVPHHASSANNPLNFLRMFPTKNYLISTEGSNGYHHPGKQTLANIAKIHKDDKEAFLYCNYPTWKDHTLNFMVTEPWNVKQDICTITDEDDEIILSFKELKNKGIYIYSRNGNEIKISL